MTTLRWPVRFGRRLLVVGAVVALLLGVLPSVSAQSAQGLEKMSSEALQHVQTAGPTDFVPLIVQTNGPASAAHFARLQGLGALMKARYTAISGYAASLPAAAVSAL